ncbi:tryptophan transporter [Iocasia frigidifontis]|uniref:Tryptophan transporter n=1 Tax=Iocasia fonsfrigidae TaxID=2682810 RepID=A0A8A7KD27_9FIRM|nr:tryptophan transporter [Iocasia fonsfrigidae]QTL98005.1 tryptophan transporter [Iocasia fonsfrigidae]
MSTKGFEIRDLAEAALLVSIGFILHAFFPAIVMGMKPDFSLAMMFIVLIVKRDLKLGFLVALATGIFTALTTTFPGGQYANIIDKLVTFAAVSAIIRLLADSLDNRIGVGIVTAVGTVISGAVFLGSAALITGLPGPFSILFYTVVLPAAVINAVTSVVLYMAFTYSRGFVSKKDTSI